MGGASRVLRRIVGNPALYDFVQRLCGLRHTQRRLRPLLADTADRVVLDVGAGTGLVLPLLPLGARYIWMDNDPGKLEGGTIAFTLGLRRVLGDATHLPLRDRSVDVALCIAMSHHLADDQLDTMLAELARVVRRHLVFLDALAVSGSLRSRLLWALDRGGHPRTAATIQRHIERRFVIDCLQSYAVYHRYLLCTAVPRAPGALTQ